MIARPTPLPAGVRRRAWLRLAVARAAAAAASPAVAAQLSGAHRPHRRSGQHHLGRRRAARSKPKLADLEAKSGIQLVVATVNSLEGQEIEPYANAAVPRLEARREAEEQRRAAAGRAERAPGAHRGRLRPRRHADRRAVEGHHHQRDHAALQDRRFRRRHRARRRRHHHRADHRLHRNGRSGPRCGSTARQNTDPVDWVDRRGSDRASSSCSSFRPASAGSSSMLRCNILLSSGQLVRRRLFGSGGGGGFSGGGGSSGGGGASGSW